MQNLKNTSGWESGWQDVTTRGTPLLDNLTINSRDGEGFSYLLPILSSNKTIEQFVIFEMNITVGEGEICISLDKPIFVSKEIAENQPDLKKLVVSMKVYNNLSQAGYVVDPYFIPDECKGLESRNTPRFTKVYQIYYTYKGKRFSPWEEDKNFLGRFLDLYNQIFSSSSYPCHIRLYSDQILVVFTGLPDKSISFDSGISELLSRTKHSIPEVCVVPDEIYCDIYSDESISISEYPAGVYVQSGQKMVAVVGHSSTANPPEPEYHLDHVDPCDYMADRIRDENFNLMIENLRDEVTASYEVSICFRLSSSGRTDAFMYEVGEIGAGEVKFKVDEPIDGIVHTHNSDGLPVFSIDDLIIPYNLLKDKRIVDGKRFTMGLVTSHTTLFLFFDMKVYSKWMESNTKNLGTFTEVYEKVYGITKDTPSDFAVARFAQFLNSLKIGITLMEKDTDSELYERVDVKAGKVIKKICY